MGLLPDTLIDGLRMRRECREHFPRHLLQRKPLVSDQDMYHGTCGTHVPWCMSGSLTRGVAGNTFPVFPVHAQPSVLRIWQEAHVIPSLLSCEWWVNLNFAFCFSVPGCPQIPVCSKNRWFKQEGYITTPQLPRTVWKRCRRWDSRHSPQNRRVCSHLQVRPYLSVFGRLLLWLLGKMWSKIFKCRHCTGGTGQIPIFLWPFYV